MILHFLAKKGEIYEQSTINNKTVPLCSIVLVFCKIACACASAGVLPNPSQSADWTGNPSRSAYVAQGEVEYICHNSHVCRATAASSFCIYALIFFHNARMQRTLETVCVIDDKTKHSARWFPYFWNTLYEEQWVHWRISL